MLSLNLQSLHIAETECVEPQHSHNSLTQQTIQTKIDLHIPFERCIEAHNERDPPPTLEQIAYGLAQSKFKKCRRPAENESKWLKEALSFLIKKEKIELIWIFISSLPYETGQYLLYSKEAPWSEVFVSQIYRNPLFEELSLTFLKKKYIRCTEIVCIGRKNILHIAIETGQERLVQKICSLPKELFEPMNSTRPLYGDDCFPILMAAFHGNPHILQALLDADCNPFQTNYKGDTPLHIACRQNKMEAALLLIEKSKGLTLLANKDGLTPLMVSLMHHSERLAYTLLQREENLLPILSNADLIQQLCKHKPLVELLVQKAHLSPLHIELAQKHTQNALTLVMEGKYILEADSYGLSPFHYAVINNMTDIAINLIPSITSFDPRPSELLEQTKLFATLYHALEFHLPRLRDRLQHALTSFTKKNPLYAVAALQKKELYFQLYELLSEKERRHYEEQIHELDPKVKDFFLHAFSRIERAFMHGKTLSIDLFSTRGVIQDNLKEIEEIERSGRFFNHPLFLKTRASLHVINLDHLRTFQDMTPSKELIDASKRYTLNDFSALALTAFELLTQEQKNSFFALLDSIKERAPILGVAKGAATENFYNSIVSKIQIITAKMVPEHEKRQGELAEVIALFADALKECGEGLITASERALRFALFGRDSLEKILSVDFGNLRERLMRKAAPTLDEIRPIERNALSRTHFEDGLIKREGKSRAIPGSGFYERNHDTFFEDIERIYPRQLQALYARSMERFDGWYDPLCMAEYFKSELEDPSTIYYPPYLDYWKKKIVPPITAEDRQEFEAMCKSIINLDEQNKKRFGEKYKQKLVIPTWESYIERVKEAKIHAFLFKEDKKGCMTRRLCALQPLFQTLRELSYLKPKIA